MVQTPNQFEANKEKKNKRKRRMEKKRGRQQLSPACLDRPS